jgi:ubiquinone/menaquinone biosynthesis C-methylase UbiE
MSSALTALRRSFARAIEPTASPSPPRRSTAEQPYAPEHPVPMPPQPKAKQGSLRSEIMRRYFTGLGVTRTELAHRYIRGAGIEFGALDFPTAVPPGTVVIDADFQPAEKVKELFSVEETTQPQIVSDLESMRGIGDESQDFIIANHVMEHVEDPLKALRSVSRVLRPNGVAFLALPEKRSTFDKDREITTLAHLLRDHEEGPDWSLAGHYEEWVRVVDGMTGEAHAQKVALMLEQRANIHFHVWDFAAMMELFTYVEREPSFRLAVENATLNNLVEVVWILRKR